MGEAAIDIRLLQVQLLDTGIQGDHLVEQTLGLHAEVDRMRFGLEDAHCLLRLVQVLADLGQRLLDELQLARGFGRVPVDVLAHVGGGDPFEHLPRQVGVGVVVGQSDNARVGALLQRHDVRLKVADRGEDGLPGDVEARAGIGRELPDLDGDALRAGQLADGAVQDQRAARVVKVECAPAQVTKLHLVAEHLVGHFQLEDIQHFAAPAIAAEPEMHRPGKARRVTSRQVVAEHGKPLRLRLDIQVQVVHGLADHQPRGDQCDFGHRLRRGGPQRLGQVAEPGQAGCLLFDLDDRRGLVDRRGEQCVQHAGHAEEPGDGDDQPLVVEQCAE